MNRKGFTLIELIATIVILALVVSISAYSITNIVRRSRIENYKLLISEINNAGETYYQECKYSNNSGISCNDDGIVTLGDLVKFGYLKGNSTDGNDKYTIVNPNDGKNISDCKVKVTYNSGEIYVIDVSNLEKCPSDYDIN